MSARDEADLVGGAALVEHYKDNRWQTFHHEPSVASVVLEAIVARPDLLVRLLIESGAVSEVVQGKELLDPEGEWDDCTWLAVNVSLDVDEEPQPFAAKETDA